MEIRWRPSKGRGEYEYSTADKGFQGKRIVVEVPILGIRIPTDVRFDFKNGKRRLRRDKPNDHKRLNFPPLAAALAGLPSPQRSDQTSLSFPLQPNAYVVDTVYSEVVHEDQHTVVLSPRALKPRNFSGMIDIEQRVSDLMKARATLPAANALLNALAKGINKSSLAKLANAAHAALPFAAGHSLGTPSPSPLPPTPASGAPSTSSPTAIDEELDDIIESYVGKEGKERIRTHRYKERDKVLVAKAKRLFKQTYGKLFCECCGINFSESYAPLGKDFIEAHHRLPLEKIMEETETKAKDLAMLCPNCHRMVHKIASVSIDEVRTILQSNNAVINEKNLAVLKKKKSP